MRDSAWIVAVMAGASKDEPRPHFLCKRCGERAVTEVPVRVDTYIEIGKGFVRAHEKCRVPDERAVHASMDREFSEQLARVDKLERGESGR